MVMLPHSSGRGFGRCGHRATHHSTSLSRRRDDVGQTVRRARRNRPTWLGGSVSPPVNTGRRLDQETKQARNLLQTLK
jgi:hypothetical protein